MTYYFSIDNTEGFTPAEIAAMNDAYNHNLAIALADLPDGAESDDFLLEQVKQSVGEALLSST